MFSSKIMILVKKSMLTSCTSFRKSMKTSLLSMSGSMVTEKYGWWARLAWGWVDFSVKLLCPPGSPEALASAPLPPWAMEIWPSRYMKIHKACLLQAAFTAMWTHHISPRSLTLFTHPHIAQYPACSPTRMMMKLMWKSKKILKLGPGLPLWQDIS